MNVTAQELLAIEVFRKSSFVVSVEVVRGCAYVLYRGSRYVDPEPDTYCDNDAEPGEDFCTDHLDRSDDE